MARSLTSVRSSNTKAFSSKKTLAKSEYLSGYRKILYGPNPNGESEILSIYRNPPLSALDLALSIFSGLSPALILIKARLWIFGYIGFDLISG